LQKSYTQIQKFYDTIESLSQDIVHDEEAKKKMFSDVE
jgi:hypothetical protein